MSSNKNWVFAYNPNLQRWETYRNPQTWSYELTAWMYQTFGPPSRDNGWDYHGGSLYFWREDYKNWFTLRWV